MKNFCFAGKSFPVASLVLAATLSPSLFSPAQAQSASPRIGGPVEDSSLTTLSGNTLRIAQPRFDRGPVPEDTSGRMLLVLRRSAEQESALQQLLTDQQTRGSAEYHNWLTPADFGKRFGVADADVQTVAGYLASQGFQVGRIYQNNSAIEITGTAAQISHTFHTQMHTYQVGQKVFTANQSDPQIPRALAPVVAGFASLSNFRSAKATTGTRAEFDPATGTVKPLYDGPTVNGNPTYGISPGDLAKIYDLPAPSGTTPATIGVISDSNVNLEFIASYTSLFKTGAALPTVVVDGNDPGTSDDSLTTLEELELITAVDPKAKLTLYTSATTDYDTGLDFAIIRAVDDDAVNVLEIGASECEANLGDAANEFLSTAWEQAAAEGISVIAATGDAGSAGCDLPGAASGTEVSVGGLAVNGYASTIYDTAIGGTDFYYGKTGVSKTIVATKWSTNGGTPAFTSARGYIAEQPWNDSIQTYDQVTSNPTSLEGSGGGPSTHASTSATNTGVPYSQPTWQGIAVGVSASARVIPDLSFFAGDGANYSAYLLCAQPSDCSATTPTFTMAGGTAAAAAVFSGIAGLLVQKDGAQGNLNPELYALYAGSSSVFHDVASGSNSVACSSGTGCAGGMLSGYSALNGFDGASGMGSVDAGVFITNWASVSNAVNSPTLTLDVNGATTPVTGLLHGTLVNISVTASGSAGAPAGDVAILSTDPYAADKTIEFIRLNGGSGNDQSNYNDFLPGGTYTLVAKYPGSLTYKPAQSNTVQVTIAPEPSQVLMMSSTLPGFSTGNFSGASLAYGTPLTVTVEPFSLNVNEIGIPSGSVQVFDQQTNTQVSSLPLNSEGAATFVLNQLGVGSHSLVFQYAGDPSYLASTSILNSSGGPITAPITGAPLQTALSFVVNADVAATTLTSSTNTVSLEIPSATLTAVVQASTLPNTGHAPSGSVTFSDGNTVALTPSYDSNGNAIAVASEVVTPALVLGGTSTYSASYTPDANSIYSAGLPSNTVTINEQILGLPSTDTVTTIAASTGGTTFGNTSSLIFDINVVGTYLGIGNFTNVSGTVTVFANGVAIGSPVTLNQGSATFTVPKLNNYLELPNGLVTITAEYNGDGVIYGCLLFFCGTVPADVSYGTDQVTITGNTGGGGSSNPTLSGDFSIQALNTAQPVGPTSTLTTYGLQLTSLNNYAANYGATQPIQLSCSAPTGINCSFSATSIVTTSSISLASGTAQPNLYVSPATNYKFASLPANHDQHPWWPTAGGVTLACVLLGGIPGKRRKCQMFVMLLGVGLLSAGLGGCSGSGLQNSAADAGRVSGFGNAGSGQLATVSVGTYPVTVIATTTTTTNVMHSVTVNLVVNTQ